MSHCLLPQLHSPLQSLQPASAHITTKQLFLKLPTACWERWVRGASGAPRTESKSCQRHWGRDHNRHSADLLRSPELWPPRESHDQKQVCASWDTAFPRLLVKHLAHTSDHAILKAYGLLDTPQLESRCGRAWSQSPGQVWGTGFWPKYSSTGGSWSPYGECAEHVEPQSYSHPESPGSGRPRWPPEQNPGLLSDVCQGPRRQRPEHPFHFEIRK